MHPPFLRLLLLGILASEPAAWAIAAGHSQPLSRFTKPSTLSASVKQPIHTTRNPARPDGVTGWHPRKLQASALSTVDVLQPGRLLVVTHDDFYNHAEQTLVPVLAKMADAASSSDRRSLLHEARVYQRLDGTGIAPALLGHIVDERGRAVGFLVEYIAPSAQARRDRQAMHACRAGLQRLHAHGIAHGDPHDGNCLMRRDGTAVLIDFELAHEAAPLDEMTRDTRIMDRCIQAIPISTE